MRFHSQNYRCADCGSIEPELIELAPDAPRSTESCPEVISDTPCSHCRGTNRQRTFGAPMLGLASLPDGTDRGNRFNMAKEAAYLRSDAARLRPDSPEQKALKAEAQKIDNKLLGRDTTIRSK